MHKAIQRYAAPPRRALALCLAVVLIVAISGCGGGSRSAPARPLAVGAPYFNTVRYMNVADPYPSSDYMLVDVDLRHVLQYDLDSRAGRHSGLGRCSNLPYVSYIHCISPGAKVLLYQNVFTSVQGNLADAGLGLSANEDDTGCSSYATAAGHPSWFVRDNRAGELVNWGFANAKSTNVRHLMDVGNRGYQQACANQILATLRTYGFDGVFLDDDGWWGFYTWYDSVTGEVAWSSERDRNGYTLASYRDSCLIHDPCTWMRSIVGFNDYVAPRVRAATTRSGQHFLVIGNTSISKPGGDYHAVIAPLDGFMEESWTDGGVGLAQQSPFWAYKAAIAAWAAANRKYEMFHSWNTTEAGNTFGLAAMLLFTQGRASYSTSNGSYTGHDTWYPEYDSAEQLGQPIGPFTVSGHFSDCAHTPGVYYERRFTNGLVVANPCSTPIPSVPLGGSYSGSGDEPRNVSSVALAPNTGYILIRNGASTSMRPHFPAVSLSAHSPSIGQGEATTLTWRSTGTTACSAPWTRSAGTRGIETVAPRTSTLYAITCTAATGLTAVGSVLVTVRGTPSPSPSVVVTASPPTVEFGYPSAISWRSVDAASCDLAGPRHRLTPRGISGSVTLYVFATSTYTATCTGAGKASSARATVVVTRSPPVIPIGAKPGPPVPVIGEITLRAQAPAGEGVVYRLDGRPLSSATFHTDYLPAGLHWAEADVKTSAGKVLVLRRGLNVIAP